LQHRTLLLRRPHERAQAPDPTHDKARRGGDAQEIRRRNQGRTPSHRRDGRQQAVPRRVRRGRHRDHHAAPTPAGRRDEGDLSARQGRRPRWRRQHPPGGRGGARRGGLGGGHMRLHGGLPRPQAGRPGGAGHRPAAGARGGRGRLRLR